MCPGDVMLQTIPHHQQARAAQVMLHRRENMTVRLTVKDHVASVCLVRVRERAGGQYVSVPFPRACAIRVRAIDRHPGRHRAIQKIQPVPGGSVFGKAHDQDRIGFLRRVTDGDLQPVGPRFSVSVSPLDEKITPFRYAAGPDVPPERLAARHYLIEQVWSEPHSRDPRLVYRCPFPGV